MSGASRTSTAAIQHYYRTMVETATDQEQPKRWPSRPVRVILCIVLALAAADLVASLITGLMLRGEVNKLRAGGYLPPIAQLVPQVPSGESNAADVYLLAFDARQLSEAEESQLFGGRPGRWRPVDFLRVRGIMAANEEHLRILEQASRIPGCAFPVDWNAGPAMLFPHFAELRRSIRVLAVRAAAADREQRTDAALADCATMLRIAEHMKLEPILMSQLVAYTIQDVAVQSMRDTLSSGSPSPKAAREMLDRLSAIDNTKPFTRTMKGETTLVGLKVFDIARHGSGKEIQGLFGADDDGARAWQGRALKAYGSIARPIANLDEIAYLRAMKRSTDAVSLPWPQSKEQLQAAERSADDLPPYRSLLTKMLLPRFTRAVESRDGRTAALRAAQIGLAVVIYKSERGAYPDSLASLGRAGFRLPPDPFTQKPFRYLRRGDGFVVYSLGPDMQDQRGRPFRQNAGHGLTSEAKKRAREYDIPFRVPR